MTRRPDYWKNALVYGLASWLYGLSLSALLSSLMRVPFPLLNQALLMALLVGLWIVVLSFPRTALSLVLGGLVIAGLILSSDDNWLRFMESGLFGQIEATLRALMYFIGSRAYLTPELSDFWRLFAIASSIFSVLVLWRLGWYLIAFVALAAPLFFQLQTDDNYWLVWLALGLLALLLVASRQSGRRARHVFQRPAILPISLILIITLGLGQLLPGSLFFSPALSRWVNELDEPFRKPFETESRGLFAVGGGYDKTSSPIDGLVNRSNQPYLTVYGPARSFYLRGGVFSRFDGRTWYAEDNTWQDFPDQITAELLAVFDSFGTLIWDDPPTHVQLPEDTWLREIAPQMGEVWYPVMSQPPPGIFHFSGDSMTLWLDALEPQVVFIEPLAPKQQTIYGANAYRSLMPGQIEGGQTTFHFSSLGSSEQYYEFNQSGQVRRKTVATDEAYRVEGVFATTDRQTAEDAFIQFEIAPSALNGMGMPVTNQLLGQRRYAAVVAERDPELYDIIYGDLLPLDKVRLARDYLASHYTYDLNVTAVPREREFIDWFLDIKTGYCVHYASALALLLQDVGFATRYVEGFVAGATESEGGNQIYRRTVTTDQAHAWTEVHLSGVGWYPFDATPPAEVERLNQVAVRPLVPQDSPSEEEDIVPERELDPIRPDDFLSEEGGRRDESDAVTPVETESLKLPWRWVILIVGIIFFSWRHWVWKMRHHQGWIRWRYRGREDIMVKRIFRDIQTLHRLGGYSLPATWGSKQRFDDVLENSPALDYDNAAFAEQAIEEVFYAERTPSERQLAGLFSYHAKLELRVRNKLSWAEWWFRRYVWSSRHPL